MSMNTIRLPRAEEVEMVKKAVEEVFCHEDVPCGEVRTELDGRMLARATIPDSKRERVVCGLFRHGIVVVNVGNGELGFAVRG